MKTSGSFAEVKDKYRTLYIYCHRACIIFSIIAKANLGVDDKLTAASMVWQYIGQIVFNMLILIGTIKLPDRIVREMMGLQYVLNLINLLYNMSCREIQCLDKCMQLVSDMVDIKGFGPDAAITIEDDRR